MSDNKTERDGRKTGAERSETESERAKGGAYPSETDTRRTPPADGQPPRPASEPRGSEGSSRPDGVPPSDPRTAREITTDPSTGEPL